MSMTKRDFIFLADVLKKHRAATLSTTADEVVEVLADALAAEYPLFKEDRWLDYIAGRCGKNGGVPKKTKTREGL